MSRTKTGARAARPFPREHEIAQAIGMPSEQWRKNCHAVSLAIVKAGLFPQARVARGWCEGVSSQHSWVVLGDDCYADDAAILDCSLWSYVRLDYDEGDDWEDELLNRDIIPRAFYTNMRRDWHHPHGEGLLDVYTRPPLAGPPVKLSTRKLSREARRFLRSLGALDYAGWHWLASLAPVEGWPAGEIYAAMHEHSLQLRALIPIDRVGMLTDLNPGGLYR